VVDDDSAFQETVARYLASYRRLTAYNGWQALQVLSKHHVDVILLDLNLPDTTGLELLRQIRAERDDVEVIIVTSQAEIRNAATCIRAGAFDFLAKSYENYQQMAEHVQRALEHRRRRRADILARTDENLQDTIALLEQTTSVEMAEINRILHSVARTPLPILLEGESGVGKELLARYVHLLSDRASHPFVPMAVAQIPATLLASALFGHEKRNTGRQRLGKFELAEGGTLFLHGIDELGPSVQLDVLHALQQREIERIGAAEPAPVDVRVIAATNRDLGAEVSAGRFRADLWERLNVVRVRVPPLRGRPDDIPRLTKFLAARHAREMGRPAPEFTEEALKTLVAYAWPGNVRELESVIARMLAVNPGRTLCMADIPVEYCVEQLAAEAEPASGNMYAMASAHFERFFVRHMVERFGGNRAQAAQRMGISYDTVKNAIDGSTEAP
jgi:DNA-binding NtrC family response regulator